MISLLMSITHYFCHLLIVGSTIKRKAGKLMPAFLVDSVFPSNDQSKFIVIVNIRRSLLTCIVYLSK